MLPRSNRSHLRTIRSVSGGVCAVALLVSAPLAFAETTSHTLDLTGFTEIDASSGVTVNFQQGEAYSVHVEIENGDLDDVLATVRGDSLRLGRRSSGFFRRNRARVDFTVIAPSLSAIDASSGVSITVTDLTTGNFEIEASSGAFVNVEGICEDIEIEASSGASVSAQDFRCHGADVEASSGSSVRAYASETAAGDGSSGASIRIAGGAQVRSSEKSSGASVSIS